MCPKKSNKKTPRVMNGETMIGAPLVILTSSLLVALWPPILDAMTVLAAIFLIIGLLAIVDDLVLKESIFKSILRRIFKNSAQLH